MSTAQQPNAGLEYRIEEQGAAVVLTLCGALSLGEVGTLERCMLKLQAHRAPMLIVNASQLIFVASLGMGALVSLKRSTERNGGYFRIAGLTPAVREAFDHAGLVKHFDIYPDLAAALVKAV